MVAIRDGEIPGIFRGLAAVSSSTSGMDGVWRKRILEMAAISEAVRDGAASQGILRTALRPEAGDFVVGRPATRVYGK